MRAGAVLAIAMFVVACVSVAPSDEERVAETLARWREAMVAGDIDRLMETYSEEFSCFDAPDREAMRVRLVRLKEQRVLDRAELFIDHAALEREGDEIRVFPVEMVLADGSMTVLRLTFRDEDGAWRIVGQEW